MAETVVDVRAQRKIAVVGKLPRHLPIQLIPARHVMYHYDPWKRAWAEGSRKIRVDEISTVSLYHYGLSEHSLIHVRRIRMHGQRLQLARLKKSPTPPDGVHSWKCRIGTNSRLVAFQSILRYLIRQLS